MGPRGPEKGPIWVHSGHVATFYAFDRMVRTFLHSLIRMHELRTYGQLELTADMSI